MKVWKTDVTSLGLKQTLVFALQELQNCFQGKNHSTLKCTLFAIEIMLEIQVAPS